MICVLALAGVALLATPAALVGPAVNATRAYLSALTGRRRKLSDGAMLSICEAYRTGSSVCDLAEAYGVSVSTIRHITYWTPRDATDD